MIRPGSFRVVAGNEIRIGIPAPTGFGCCAPRARDTLPATSCCLRCRTRLRAPRSCWLRCACSSTPRAATSRDTCKSRMCALSLPRHSTRLGLSGCSRMGAAASVVDAQRQTAQASENAASPRGGFRSIFYFLPMQQRVPAVRMNSRPCETAKEAWTLSFNEFRERILNTGPASMTVVSPSSDRRWIRPSGVDRGSRIAAADALLRRNQWLFAAGRVRERRPSFSFCTGFCTESTISVSL